MSELIKFCFFGRKVMFFRVAKPYGNFCACPFLCMHIGIGEEKTILACLIEKKANGISKHLLVLYLFSVVHNWIHSFHLRDIFCNAVFV